MSIEKTIAAAQAPIVDLMDDLDQRVEKLERTQDAPIEYEIDLEKIADTLTERTDFLRMVQGMDGLDGKPGDKGEPGADGRDGVNGAGFNVKQWEPGIYRQDTIIQHDLGRTSRALRDTNEPPNSADWERLGAGGFRWCGVKQEGRAYVDGDLYIDNGTSFLWVHGKGHMFAKRGKDGADGKDGRDGTDAPQLIEVQLIDENKTLALVFNSGLIVECKMPETFAALTKNLADLAALRDDIARFRAELETMQAALNAPKKAGAM